MSETNETTNETTNQAPNQGSTSPARANISIPNEQFAVEEGLPSLPAGGRSGQSKYSPLILQAKALKVNSKFKVPTGGVPHEMFVRNIRLAIKKASLPGVKVTAIKGEDAVYVYRTA
jgi:hypothetical protein